MTQNTINALLALGVAVGIALGSFLAGRDTAPVPQPVQEQLGGGAYEALPKWFGNGLSAGTSEQFAIAASGSTTAPALALTAPAGTSTLTGVGCIGAFATSSATPVKLVLSTLGATSTFKGTAYWTYGTCP